MLALELLALKGPDLNVSPERLREAFGGIPTGVSVITTAGPDGPRGMTASAVCSVSLDPLLVLVCIDNRSQTLEAILDNGRFAINVLRASQAHVSNTFAGRTSSEEKFATVGYRLVDGSPVLDSALASVVCCVHSTAEGGDHTIVIGQVTAVDTQVGEPLVRHGGRYRRLGAEVA